MKKEELLRALGDIREDYIEDAAPDMSQRARLKAGRWRRAAGFTYCSSRGRICSRRRFLV